MRAVIIRSLNLDGRVSEVGSNVVYDSRTARGLAKKLYGLRTGECENRAMDEFAEMEALIRRFSEFEERATWGEDKSEGDMTVVSIRFFPPFNHDDDENLIGT